MSNFFHGLTLAELERLSLLAEECAEVIQVIMKIQRHGYESFHPDDPLRIPNRALLEKEIGHVVAAERIMFEALDIDRRRVSENTRKKLSWVGRYLHHQENLPEVDL